MKIKAIVVSLVIFCCNYGSGQSVNYADSLNQDKIPDAFPFITGNGLSIYYESARNTSEGSIFYSSRVNTKSYFKAPVLLGKQFDDGFGSPSLTSNELEIYVLNSNTKKLYKASRKSKTEPFGDVEEVKVLTKKQFYLPAISPDGKQLVVSDYDNGYLVFFTKNSKNEFEFAYSFEDKEDLFKGGRFSPNGLQLYAVKKEGAKDGVNDIMVVFNRKTLTEKFKNYKYVTTTKNELITDVFASVTKDEKIIAVTNNPTDNWVENNIIVYEIGRPLNSIANNKTRKNETLVYKYSSHTKKASLEPIKKQDIVDNPETSFPERDTSLESTFETLHKASETQFKNYIKEQNALPSYSNFKNYKTDIKISGFEQVYIEKYSEFKTTLTAKNSLPEKEATALFTKLKDALSYYIMFIPGHNPRKEERMNGKLLEYRFAGSNKGEITLRIDNAPFDIEAPIGSAEKFEVTLKIEKR